MLHLTLLEQEIVNFLILNWYLKVLGIIFLGHFALQLTKIKGLEEFQKFIAKKVVDKIQL